MFIHNTFISIYVILYTQTNIYDDRKEKTKY